MAVVPSRRGALAVLEAAVRQAKKAGVPVEDVSTVVSERYEGVPCPCEGICRTCDYTGRVSPETHQAYLARGSQ